jgi:hypothetical protein
MAWTLGEEPPQMAQLSGLVDVDPQRRRVRHGVLVAAGVRAHRGCDEQLIAAVRVHGCELKERFKPALVTARAAGQEVVGASAGGDHKRPVDSSAGGQLDQPV